MKKMGRKDVEEARKQWGKLIDAAQAGHTTVITKRGLAIAALVPLERYRAAPQQRSLLVIAGRTQALGPQQRPSHCRVARRMEPLNGV